MKKINALTLFILFPMFVNARSIGETELVTIGLGLVIPIGLFFLLRPVILWYWKIEKIDENIQQTNLILREIRKELKILNGTTASDKTIASDSSISTIITSESNGGVN